ncbi:MAG TPA: hypothetical protein VLI40_04560, partial [Gemmatimonadaceae bacterium]|nr:hypothetical protein [Gemmatimonadaceae bacterium]
MFKVRGLMAFLRREFQPVRANVRPLDRWDVVHAVVKTAKAGAQRLVIPANAGTRISVIPAKAGIHLLPTSFVLPSHLKIDNMDSRFRGNDEGYMDSRGADKSAPYRGNDDSLTRIQGDTYYLRRAVLLDDLSD